MHAQVVLFDGFDPLDAIAPYEVLYAGGMAAGGALTVELVSAEGPREVVSGTGGMPLRATAALDPERADLVVVPGASGRAGEPGEAPGGETRPGQQDEYISVLLARTLNTGLPALLKSAMERPEVTVATVCGGSLVLAMAGLLEGRYATTHHLGVELLAATGVHAVRARIVDDGDLVTGAGVTSGLDVGLYLLEREIGPRVAQAVEELFAHERRGVVWRDIGPAPTAF
ncbi:transcriptional regulator GlxA family with amidase domain [Thermocatellispora tengchongensis]|uniref:Transcriptional regulator GlxA family with amidase domain n=1 Tax=Thermocatellispora tengchongensis TaxID=1073253 RepID=A0A840P8R6_9ACTN|nr:DJ-1/PfpI family protein [Thermocatellispora tengchongensis]MBB5135389.1 transcriptional regulator GlxA family with amidase domain [Thermocatellispora tengchongensis]